MEILHLKEQTDIIALIAGYGSQADWMQSEVNQRGLASMFLFLGGLTPAQMKYIRRQTDIFVSCTTHGNLPNTTIEALSDGISTIIPNANPDTGVDTDTEALLPANVVLRYGPQKDHHALAEAILYLHCNAHERMKLSQAAKMFANKHFLSWHERIQNEIQILNSYSTSTSKSYE
jgi:glycosyltransferase involved in cell wall biosynthesis